jgi:hypothetical protein
VEGISYTVGRYPYHQKGGRRWKVKIFLPPLKMPVFMEVLGILVEGGRCKAICLVAMLGVVLACTFLNILCSA